MQTFIAKLKAHKKLILIILGAVLLIGAGVGGYFIWRHSSAQNSTPQEEEVVITPVEKEIVWGGDEVASTGAAYVAYQESIANNSDLPAADVLDAKFNLASYYITSKDYEAAESILLALDLTQFSTEDFYRYYNSLTRLYGEWGKTEERDKNNALATEYRNLLQAAAQ